MHRRRRLFAGVLALVAMTFSFAETVWSSACAPMPDVRAVAHTAGEDRPALDCMPAMAAADEGEGREEGERHCPFGPLAAAQGCAATASLPAPTADAPAPSSEGFVSVFSLDLQHDLLVGTTLFRPPRA